MSLLESLPVTPANLLHEVAVLRQKGYRFVTITCLHTGPEHELIYHFDRHYELVHLRLRLPSGEPLGSISSLCPPAMIVENEIKDHFGLQVEGLTVDFQGRLLLTETAPRAPMSKRCGMEIDARVPGAAPAASKPAGGEA